MKKSSLLFTVISVTAFVATIVAITPDKFDNLAKGQECAHEGYHYDYITPVTTGTGRLEYWKCCKCETISTTELEGTFLEGSDTYLGETSMLIDFPVHDKLEDYSWDELKVVANAISNDTIEESEMNRFTYFANSGETKKVNYLDTDTVAFRIVSFKHDKKSGSEEKAGITFMSVNSIPALCKYNDGGSSYNWSNSTIRARLQMDGDIYLSFPEELTKNITKVSKSTHFGYSDEDSSYNDWLIVTEDYFYLPSACELGTSYFEKDLNNEDKSFDYRFYEPFDTKLENFGNCTFACLGCLSYKSYIQILDNVDSYSNVDEAFYSVQKNGECECFLERTINPNFYKSVCVCNYRGDAAYTMNSLNSYAISPCFSF